MSLGSLHSANGRKSRSGIFLSLISPEGCRRIATQTRAALWFQQPAAKSAEVLGFEGSGCSTSEGIRYNLISIHFLPIRFVTLPVTGPGQRSVSLMFSLFVPGGQVSNGFDEVGDVHECQCLVGNAGEQFNLCIENGCVLSTSQLCFELLYISICSTTCTCVVRFVTWLKHVEARGNEHGAVSFCWLWRKVRLTQCPIRTRQHCASLICICISH